MNPEKMTRNEALKTIENYVNKPCIFYNDADVWWHEPGDLAVQFYAPEDLIKHLSINYSDEMMFVLECLNEDYEWSNQDLIPVAAVSSGIQMDAVEEKEFIKRGINPFLHDAFGYVFFELSTGQVIVSHSDGWSLDTKPYTIKGLIEEMGIKIK